MCPMPYGAVTRLLDMKTTCTDSYVGNNSQPAQAVCEVLNIMQQASYNFRLTAIEPTQTTVRERCERHNPT